MRSLGELSGKDEATQFVNILAADDIEAKTDALGEGRFEVWIYNEDDMSQAFETFKEFKASGLTQEFQEKAKLGKEKACEANTSRPQVVDVRTQVFGKTSSGLLTNAMIGVCILLFFLEYRLGNEISLKYFYMADLTGGRYYPGLNEILAGEVWRLVSWSFLHGSLFHILFNMAWLYKLGRMVEEVSGVFAFVVLFLVSGVVGGLLQYWATGPYFVGMSGFVYALFGYSWIMGRFLPGQGVEVAKEDVTLMIVWFVLCLFMGFVANSAHAGGLAVGMIYAYIKTGHFRRLIQYPKMASKALKSPAIVLLLCVGAVAFEHLF